MQLSKQKSILYESSITKNSIHPKMVLSFSKAYFVEQTEVILFMKQSDDGHFYSDWLDDGKVFKG